MEKVVALDIGGVCINLHHPEAFVYFGWDPRQPLPPVFLEAVDQFECGKITESEWLDRMIEFTGGRFSAQQIIHGWNIIIGKPIDGMPEFLRELTQKGYRLVFFSDTSALHIAKLCHDAEFTHLVTGAVYSYEVGARKPSDPMYEAFERQYGKPALYLDDKPENIAGGERHGWRGYRFDSVAGLRQYLAAELA